MQHAIKYYFNKNHLVKYVCSIFIFLFCFYIFLKKFPEKWIIYPDTYGYFQLDLKNPLRFIRTPGLPLFYSLIADRPLLDKTFNTKWISPDEARQTIPNQPEVDGQLARIARINIFLCSFAYVCLFMALARLLPTKYAFGIPLFLASFTPIFYLNIILTDPLAYALCIIFVAIYIYIYILIKRFCRCFFFV